MPYLPTIYDTGGWRFGREVKTCVGRGTEGPGAAARVGEGFKDGKEQCQEIVSRLQMEAR